MKSLRFKREGVMLNITVDQVRGYFIASDHCHKPKGSASKVYTSISKFQMNGIGDLIRSGFFDNKLK